MIELPGESSPPFFALLPLASEAGVYSLPRENVAALVDAAEGLDFGVHRIALAGCHDKAMLMQRFAHALAFPDWFGHNWDALADALADLEWLDEVAGRVLLIEDAQDLRRADETDYDRLVVLLDEASEGWREVDLPFWSFLCEDPSP